MAIRSVAEDGGIPLTIHGVIAARLDRLDEHRRRVLMDAAVVGREFLYRVVREVTGDPELDRALGGLVGADLVRVKAPEPDLEYLFKHALTQEGRLRQAGATGAPTSSRPGRRRPRAPFPRPTWRAPC